MRIAELSRDSGVPVPTIKYYVREGLLQPGELTSPNQAQYDDSHLRRLKLIRALAEVGGLSIATIRDLLAAVGSPATEPARRARQGPVRHHPRDGYQASDASRQAAARQAGELIDSRGWQVSRIAPPASCSPGSWPPCATSARTTCSHWPTSTPGPPSRSPPLTWPPSCVVPPSTSRLEGVIIASVLGDTLLAALRRLAEENASARAVRSRNSVDPRPSAES